MTKQFIKAMLASPAVELFAEYGRIKEEEYNEFIFMYVGKDSGFLVEIGGGYSDLCEFENIEECLEHLENLKVEQYRGDKRIKGEIADIKVRLQERANHPDTEFLSGPTPRLQVWLDETAFFVYFPQSQHYRTATKEASEYCLRVHKAKPMKVVLHEEVKL